MPEKNETRRELFQKTALVAGAAALLQKNASADEAPWSPASGTPSPCMKFFPSGFRNERIKTSGAEINAVIGGSGPPVLMFHGAPESRDHLAYSSRRISPRTTRWSSATCAATAIPASPRTSRITPANPSAPWRWTESR